MILTFDLIATLTLGVGTLLLSATHLLIMLYLSVKFRQICFSSLCDIAEIQFVTDERTDRRRDGSILICHRSSFGGIKNFFSSGGGGLELVNFFTKNLNQITRGPWATSLT